MQDALLAFVLNSEGHLPSAMTDTPTNPEAKAPAPRETDERSADEQLMIDFLHGKTDAFTKLFGRYKQPVYGFFRRRLTDPSHAEELTQETFLVIVRMASGYKPQALFRTYLYAIAFKILRAHRRKIAFRAAFFGERKSAQDPAGRDRTDAGLVIREAVSKLNRVDREILMLREFEELSYAEIAELLKLPMNTVRSRLFRARMALKELLTARPQKSPQPKLAESEERV
jgi:RNA polymerase sigma-70 factor, ECF subfamily